ncbi:hypothetical protein PROFUN_06037 [Planoprotostelium fungivorum]|uniref:RanBP2-type domain-containing protein n=1 Tax=Planoprotostelium fungivorum TaxID=1890364 RepID=A0A2P6NPN4_9EUKA|nr:hypothetical protein PROFUN_06037 [Planoprotostelium fungivorum]
MPTAHTSQFTNLGSKSEGVPLSVNTQHTLEINERYPQMQSIHPRDMCGSSLGRRAYRVDKFCKLMNHNAKNTSIKLGYTVPSNAHTIRYDAPCRYWRFGTCKMADHCRFSHAEPQDELPESLNSSGSLKLSRSVDSDLSIASSSSWCEDVVGPDISSLHLSRRPFVHVIVLYAGGIGVLAVPPSGHTDGKVSCFAREVCARLNDSSLDHFFHCKLDSAHYIRTENLSEIIGHSKSDYLVVIGDRNMKNRTIQVRRRAKLVEMTVDEAINYMWSEVEVMDSDTVGDASLLTQPELYSLVDKYCGVRHYTDRIERLRSDLEELDRVNRDHPRPLDQTGRAVMCERAIYKLTQIQRSLIRMHQQLSDAVEKMEAEMDGEFPRKGAEVSDPNHNPTAHPVMAISSDVHRALYNFVSRGLLYSIEKLPERGMKAYNSAMLLWNAHMQEYGSSEEEEEPDDAWRCRACTLINNVSTSQCEVCQCPRENSKEDSENQWLNDGRTRRKQRRQQRDAERAPVPSIPLLLRKSQESSSNSFKISPPAPRERSLSSSALSSRWMHPPNIVPDPVRSAGRGLASNRRPSVAENPQMRPVSRAISLDTVRSLETDRVQNKSPQRSLPASPSKPPGGGFFSDLWSADKKFGEYSSLPSTAFEFVPHQLELFSHRDAPQAEPVLHSDVVDVDQGVHLLNGEGSEPIEQVRSHSGGSLAERPCLYCGEESWMECTFCARSNRPPAFFCSAEHQSKMWRQHSAQHNERGQPVQPHGFVDVNNRGGHVNERGGPLGHFDGREMNYAPHPGAPFYNQPNQNGYWPAYPSPYPVEFDMFNGRDFSASSVLTRNNMSPFHDHLAWNAQQSNGMENHSHTRNSHFNNYLNVPAPTGIFG